MAAQPGAPARADHVGDALRDQVVPVLLRQEPLRPPAHHAVQQFPRNPFAQLRILRRVLVLEPVVLGPRRAIGHEDGGRVERLGLRHERRHVLVERRNRKAVFLSGIAVGHLREVELEVERALDGGGDAVFLAGLDDPLAHNAVAGHVLLQGVGAIRLLVALHEAERGIAVFDARTCEHARPGGVDARARHQAAVHHVGVGEHVRRRSLRIARGGHAVGEVGEVLPDLGLMQAAWRPHMRMRVHQAGHDGLAGDADRPRAGWHRERAAAAHRRDAVVGDQHVALRDHLVTLHRDDARAGQEHRPFRFRSRHLDDYLGLPRLGGGDVLPEELRAPGPGHGGAVGGPVQVIAAVE